MNPLLAFTDRHPLATGGLGTLSGVGTYLLSALDVAAGVAGKVSMLLGCAVTAVTLALVLHRWRHRNDWTDQIEWPHRPIHDQREVKPGSPRRSRANPGPLDPDDHIPGL